MKNMLSAKCQSFSLEATMYLAFALFIYIAKWLSRAQMVKVGPNHCFLHHLPYMGSHNKQESGRISSWLMQHDIAYLSETVTSYKSAPAIILSLPKIGVGVLS